MYSKAQRDEQYKAELISFLSAQYGITPMSIATANHGFYGETWKIAAADKAYFGKLIYAAEYKKTYMASFPAIEYLTDRGIEFIPKLVKTLSGELYSIFDDAVLGVFEWVDGENVQNDESIAAEYRMLARVYAAGRPDFDIPREDFDESGPAEFYDRLQKIGSAELNAFFDSLTDRLVQRADRLKLFAKRCKETASEFYITHGDPGGNVLKNGNSFYLVDWDTLKLAPPERDAWFCMGWSEKPRLFEQSLAAAGIDYKLNADRLAYYAYFFYFYYLNAYMKAFSELPDNRAELLAAIKDYSSGWIEESFIIADRIK
jgi:hypothetical protein